MLKSKECKTCSKNFTFEKKRGREPNNCLSCRESQEKSKIETVVVTKDCAGCGASFSYERKRGRQPERCTSCKEQKQKEKSTSSVKEFRVKSRLNSLEIVDRLESDLKAAGLHISQHRDKW